MERSDSVMNVHRTRVTRMESLTFPFGCWCANETYRALRSLLSADVDTIPELTMNIIVPTNRFDRF